MADALRREPGFQVEVSDGNKGEFAVLVDGQPVAQKKGEALPSVEEALAAAKKAAHVAVG